MKKKKPEKKEKHVHKYIMADVGVTKPYEIFRCFDGETCPKPTHYIRADLAVGHKTRCHQCDKVVIMSIDMSKKKKPKCLDCKLRTKADKSVEMDVLGDLFDFPGKG